MASFSFSVGSVSASYESEEAVMEAVDRDWVVGQVLATMEMYPALQLPSGTTVVANDEAFQVDPLEIEVSGDE